jgi:lipoprotein-anchoring transpeptidase ErfK/SrfK
LTGSGEEAAGFRVRIAVRAALVAAGGFFVLVGLAACQSGSSAVPGAVVSTPRPVVSSVAPIPPVQVTVLPADNATGVALAASVTVATTDGTIKEVTVSDADGGDVNGTLDAGADHWVSTDSLVPATHYLVTATALDGAGHPTTVSSSFTTAAPAKTLGVKIAPLEGEVVGVGMPIVVYFTTPVTDKAAVESHLSVDMSEQVPGAWHWYGSEEVHFRPAAYWPAGEQVTLHADLKGVNAGKGVWGVENRTLDFTVGDAHITTVNAKTDVMTVTDNGAVVRTAKISTGRDKYPTTSGIHVVLEKTPSIIMDSATVGIPKGNPDYYYETVQWDVRISWSGEFVHSAPWSVSEQGRENVSHGCVNASPADAQWFYGFSRRGDIVVITNTDRPLVSGNGWTDWNLSWAAWTDGSALPGGGADGSAVPGSTIEPGASSGRASAVTVAPATTAKATQAAHASASKSATPTTSASPTARATSPPAKPTASPPTSSSASPSATPTPSPTATH